MLKLLDRRETGYAQCLGDYYTKIVENCSQSLELDPVENFDDSTQNLGFAPDGRHLVTYQTETRLFSVFYYRGFRYNNERRILRVISKMRLTQVSDDIVEFKGYFYTNDSKHLVIRIAPRRRVQAPTPSMTQEEQRAQIVESLTSYSAYQRERLHQEAVRTGDPVAMEQVQASLEVLTPQEEEEEVENGREDIHRQALFTNVVRDFQLGGNDRNVFLVFELKTGRIVSKLSIMNIMESVYMNDRILTVINKYSENIDVYELTQTGSFNKIQHISGVMNYDGQMEESEEFITSYNKYEHHSHIRHRMLNRLYENTVVEEGSSFVEFFETTKVTRVTNLIAMDDGYLSLFWEVGEKTKPNVLVLMNYKNPDFFEVFHQWDDRFRTFLYSYLPDFLPPTMAKINSSSSICYIEKDVFNYLDGISCENKRFQKALALIQILRNIKCSFLSPLLDQKYFRWEKSYFAQILKRVEEYESPTIFDFEWNVLEMAPKIFCARTGRLLIKSVFTKNSMDPKKRKGVERCLTVPFFHPVDLFFLFVFEGGAFTAKLDQVKQ